MIDMNIYEHGTVLANYMNHQSQFVIIGVTRVTWVALGSCGILNGTGSTNVYRKYSLSARTSSGSLWMDCPTRKASL